jgi:carotenoid cleavage dioxygenase-like enzyme
MTDLAEPTSAQPVSPTTGERKQPWHLRGNFAPVFDEVTLTDELRVTGEIPKELNGLFVRNGANPKSGKSPHWFFGNGMLHGLQLRDGKAEWYRNRYVVTPKLEHPNSPPVNADGSIDRTASAANTHVIHHAGRILALEEGHFPWEVDRELNTIGAHTFDDKLTTSMTAHPKICPETGEMLFFGYSFLPPYLTYHRASATGELVQSTEIPVMGPTMQHDFNVTRNFVIFMDLPVVFDIELAMKGTMPFRWDDNYGARLGVMPRNGTAADLKWYEIEPCYVFHPMNAYERGTGDDLELVLDVGRFKYMWRKGSEEFDNVALLHRWVIQVAKGTTYEEQLDDRPAEFARVADSVIGLPNRFGYMAATRPGNGEAVFSTEIFKYDLTAKTSQVHSYGPNRRPGEAVFVADPNGTAEDHGWLLNYVWDATTDTSDLVIVDSRDFIGAPIATVHLPRRIPFGFHGSWVPDLS